MRPYLAIIIDSFRAAVASRVLYIMLVLITLLFFLICPLSLKETTDWKLSRQQHLTKPEKVVERLIEKGKSGKTKSTKRVWSLLSADLQKSLQKAYDEIQGNESPVDGDKTNAEEGNEGDRAGGRRRNSKVRVYENLVTELNDIICQQDFYQADDWGRFAITGEVEEILEESPDSLSVDQSRRLNRLLVGKAIPALEKPDGSTVTLYYWLFTWDPYWTFPVGRSVVARIIAGITSFFFDKILMSAGIFIGILITANIIPQTFDPGSLNLMLSKPISRSGLYLSRFFGGCSQVLICSAYLFFGAWLWLGLGVGLWDSAFLWSIPIYALVFAIYFSVSAFVGLLYRSPILSIVMAVVFWAVCYAVGSGYGILGNRLENQRKYDPIVTDNTVAAIDGVGNGVVWNPTENQWSVAGEPSNSGRQEEQTAIAIAQWVGKIKEKPYRLRPTIGSDGKVYTGLNAPIPPDRSSNEAFVLSSETTETKKLGDFPFNTMALCSGKEGQILANRSGKFELLDPNESENLKTTSLGPDEPTRIATTFSVSMNTLNEEIAVHEFADSQHSVVVFRRKGEQYVRDRSKTIDIGTSKKIKCYLAYAGDSIVVVAGNNSIVLLDSKTLDVKTGDLTCETKCGIEKIAASPDGNWFAMMYANRNFWLLNAKEQSVRKPAITGQGNVSSVSFDLQNRLCVIDRESRLNVYVPNGLSKVETYSPSDGVFELAFRYLITPVYTVFPKPSEFYKVTAHLSSARDTSSNPEVDLIEVPVLQNPLLPL